jgi:uncharacterized protein YwgA
MRGKSLDVTLCLHEMGFKINMKNFEHRLLLQKMIYMLQVFGVDLGFRYGWYLRGPYCSELAHIGYEIYANKDKIPQVTEQYELPGRIRDEITHFQSWVSKKMPSNCDKIKWLELLASLHYLKHFAYFDAPKNKANICSELISLKDWYTPADVEKAWTILDEVGLIKNVQAG